MPDVCTWPAIPVFTSQINVRYLSNFGNDLNSGLAVNTAWRSIQGRLENGGIPDSTLLKVVGSTYTPPNGTYIFGRYDATYPIPNNLTIIANDGYRNCVIDGKNQQGVGMLFWYPSTVRTNFEMWGLRLENWVSTTITGGSPPITIGGNFDGVRFIGCKFTNNGFNTASLDHDIYLAGGLSYNTAARNITIEHCDFDETHNNGHRIKIGSGGTNSAGPNGGQSILSNSHHISIRYNTIRTKGWGALLVAGEYAIGTQAQTVVGDNLIISDCTDIRDYLGNPVSSNYAGTIYFTYDYRSLVGCDTTFIVENNQIQVSASDQSDWYVIYSLGNGSLQNGGTHTPTVRNNKLSHLTAPARLISGIALGTNYAGVPTLECNTFNLNPTSVPTPPPTRSVNCSVIYPGVGVLLDDFNGVWSITGSGHMLRNDLNITEPDVALGAVLATIQDGYIYQKDNTNTWYRIDYQDSSPPAPAPTPPTPPTVLSAQNITSAMVANNSPSTNENWNLSVANGGFGYPANQYGAGLFCGARLKHNSNLSITCVLVPFNQLLAKYIIHWMTINTRIRLAAGHNVAVELIPTPSYGRIRPDLNGGLKQWVKLFQPDGSMFPYIIDSSGTSVSNVPANETVRFNSGVYSGTRILLPTTGVLHPLAQDSSGGALIPVSSLVSTNTSDAFAASKIDDMVHSWWVRLVSWDGNPLPNLSGNPVLAVASADPYPNLPPRFNGVTSGTLLTSSECLAAIAATRTVILNTSWQQIGWHTSTDAPDKYTNQAYAGISNTEFLSSLPPGYV